MAEQLQRDKEELDRRLDKDAKAFLEHIAQLEQQVEDLETNSRELQARGPGESSGQFGAEDRERQDMLAEFESFQQEKEEEMQQVREETAQLHQRLLRQVQTSEQHQRKVDELERERDLLLAIMSEEGQELRFRLDKALQDKEALSLDLGRAQAIAEAAQAFGGSSGCGQSDAELQLAARLRSASADCEAMKDELSNKEAQLVLLRGQLDAAERKLRLADYENTMLKSELEALRHQMASAAAAGAAAGGHLLVNR